jgi:hypothetical protein
MERNRSQGSDSNVSNEAQFIDTAMQNSFDGSKCSRSDQASFRAEKGDTYMQNSFDRGSDLNVSGEMAVDHGNPFDQSMHGVGQRLSHSLNQERASSDRRKKEGRVSSDGRKNCGKSRQEKIENSPIGGKL